MTHNFQPGTLAYVLHEPPNPNRVRSEPRADATVVGWLHPGVVMQVTQEPVVVGTVVWCHVQSTTMLVCRVGRWQVKAVKLILHRFH